MSVLLQGSGTSISTHVGLKTIDIEHYINHMAAMLPWPSFKLTVTATYGERGLCWLYNPSNTPMLIFLLRVTMPV